MTTHPLRCIEPQFGEHARTRKVFEHNGVIQEVWHEVFDFAGKLIHQDRKPINREDPEA